MEISIDTASAVPVYEQIMAQVRQAIVSGRLKAGSSLPSIRQLAEDLDINPNTVAKAYQLLERSHVINSAGRRGTMVRDDALTNIDRHLETDAFHKLGDILRECVSSGIEKEKLRKMIREILEGL